MKPFKTEFDKGWIRALLSVGIDEEMLYAAMYRLGYDKEDIQLAIQAIYDHFFRESRRPLNDLLTKEDKKWILEDLKSAGYFDRKKEDENKHRYEYTMENLKEDMQGVEDTLAKKKFQKAQEKISKHMEENGITTEDVHELLADVRAERTDDHFTEHNPETPSLEEVIEKFYKENLTLSEQLEEWKEFYEEYYTLNEEELRKQAENYANEQGYFVGFTFEAFVGGYIDQYKKSKFKLEETIEKLEKEDAK